MRPPSPWLASLGVARTPGLGWLAVFLGIASVGAAQQLHAVRGRVILPVLEEAFVQGDGYLRDGSPAEHSEDTLASLNNNVIVYAQQVQPEPRAELAPTERAIITQRQMTFLPHVLPVTRGSTVYILNEDEYFHNVYTLTPGSRFNIGRRPPGSPYPVVIEHGGPITLRCDIHPHMKGIILSLDTEHFTRAAADGTFRLGGLPAGEYELVVYHPTRGELSRRVTVPGAEASALEFAYTD